MTENDLAWRAMVAAAFRHGAEAEAEYRASLQAVRTTDAQRAADDEAETAAEAEYERQRSDNEDMGSDD